MHGLAYARSDDYGPNMTYEQLKLNECIESAQMFQLYVIEVSDLSVGFQPASKFFFNDVPLASGGGSMKFDNDGRVSYSEYGETQSGQADAWFMLRANCTVLRR